MSTRKAEKAREFWKEHVENFQSSNMSQRAYCREMNISYWSFNYWKRRIETGNTTFTEIPQKKTLELYTRKKAIEVLINENIRISIPADFSPETLTKIFQILGIVQ